MRQDKTHLTDRQKQVLIGLASGKPRKTIAVELGISETMANKETVYIYNKINRRTIADATRFAVAHGLVTANRQEFPCPV